DKIFRGGEVRRQKDSLAGAQSVCLDDYRESHRVQRAVGFLRRIKRAIHLCRRNAVALQKLFRENFAAFQLRGLLGGTNNSPISLPEHIRKPSVTTLPNDRRP